MQNTIHRPKPREKLFFFLAGMIMSVPFPLLIDSLINHALDQKIPIFYATLISGVIFAPLFEEFAKAYPLFYRHGETERSIVSLGFYTGLGFGAAEFVFYTLFLHAPISARLPALLFHSTNTSIVAFGIAKNKLSRFYFIAVGLHALNNFSANFGAFWYFGGLGALLGSYLLAWRLIRRTTETTIEI